VDSSLGSTVARLLITRKGFPQCQTPTELTLHDVMARLDSIDDRVGALFKCINTLERTVNRYSAAMGAGFGMMSDQLTHSCRLAAELTMRR